MSKSNQKITISLPQLSDEIQVDIRSTPLDLYNRIKERLPWEPAAATVDGQLLHLTARLFLDAELRFLPMQSREAGRVYRRSLVAMLSLAVRSLFPRGTLKVQHGFGKGLFCTVELDRDLRESDVQALQDEMRRITAADLPFQRVDVPLAEALDRFQDQGSVTKHALLLNSIRESVPLCRLDGRWELWTGPFYPSTAWIRDFHLRHYPPGFIMRYPYWMNPYVMPSQRDQPKLFQVFQEYERWGEILGLDTVGELSRKIIEGRSTDVINLSEALHERRIAEISAQVARRFPQTRVVLISGPSASGKTTFTRRLSTQIRVTGLSTRSISLDDYFLDRQHTPRDENGDYDFEALEAIDVALFNQHLLQLLKGEEVNIPRFDFKKGKRADTGRPMRLGSHDVILIEGIHGLNDSLTQSVPSGAKFKIYCSALTNLNMDLENSMSTSDTRLLRRLVRDYLFRGYSAEETLDRWESVNRGAFKYIFPFQEQADVMFNSALVYEHAVLSTYVLPVLMTVQRGTNAYLEARRLIHLLSYFLPIPSERVPHTSLLREFIGGSSFYN